MVEGERTEQSNFVPEERAYSAWERMASEVPFAGGQEQTNEPEEQQEIDEPISVEEMIRRAEEDGFQPKGIGEQSVLSIGRDGQARVESNYRDLWMNMTKNDPDFYSDPRNQAFSTVLWNVGNAVMFDDLDPNSSEDKIVDRIWNECKKLNAFLKDSEYHRRAMRFLDQMDSLGDSGAKALISVQLIQELPVEGRKLDIEMDEELKQKEEKYERLNQAYQETMLRPVMDSEEMLELAEDFDKLGDYVDAREKAEKLRNLVGRLESIVTF